MAQSTHHTAILLLLFHITSNSATPVSPVYEVNEQARMDDKRTGPQTFFPYSNPLAGNSLQNAQIHAQHQQAMFNAEKIRQHRAQLQRWTKIPPHSPQTDSYMKAYHESQENHQLAIEEQQANHKDGATPDSKQRPSVRQRTTTSHVRQKPTTASLVRQRQSTSDRQRPIKRIKTTEAPETLQTIENIKETVTAAPRQRSRNLKRLRGPDPMKITIEDAVLTQKNRNHRSYGSAEFQHQQHLIPKSYKNVYLSPETYEGVTIKPNGNVGIAQLHKEEPSKLYTEAIPSKYVYPKQFHQMQSYESAQDIATLNALLNKEPQDQVKELNALIHSNKELETPIDLYFYLKDPKLAQQYSQALYAQGPTQNYASAYMPEIKDHIPITELIDDIEDPNKILKLPYTAAPTKATEDITTNVFYQDPTVPTRPEYEDDKPTYPVENLKYNKPLKFYNQDTDESERYLHHNGQTGVQHLNQDGTGVSAYGDDDVSNRTKRSVDNLDRKLFVSAIDNLDKNNKLDTGSIKNINVTTIKETISVVNEPLPVPEELKHKVIFRNGEPYVSAHNLDSSEEYDYDDSDDLDDNDDYNAEFDDTDFHDNTNLYKGQANNFDVPNDRIHDNVGSFSNRFGQSFKSHGHSDFNSYGIPSNSYGAPAFSMPTYGVPASSYVVPTSYGVPTNTYGEPPNSYFPSPTYGAPTPSYGVPSTMYGVPHGLSKPDISSVVNSLEPVYMLTQSQLKSLVGDHNLNIQHLDLHQWQGKKKTHRSRPRKYRKKYRRPSRRHVKKNLSKLHKLRIL